MITPNEKKILRFLLTNFNRDYSINEIAKNCHLAPNGAYEILKKLEEKSIVQPKKIANLKSYKINFNSKETIKLLELILVPDYQELKTSHRYKDLSPLEKVSQLAVIFGSYATKEKPNDLDVLFVLRKPDYKKFMSLLEKVKLVVPLKLHDVIQTKADLKKNIKNQEELIIKIISEGIVLWGHEFLIGVIKDAQKL